MKNKIDTGLTIERPGQRRQWFTKTGIAKHYGICQRSVTNLMRRRVLPYVKVGGIVRFDLEACDRAMRAFQIQSVAGDLP